MSAFVKDIRNAPLQKHLPYHSVGSKNTIKSMIYSTVTEYFGYGVLPYLHFTLNLSSQNLLTPVYSVYQQSLYDKITSLREKGMNFIEIANWLNTKGYKTPRGRIFRNNHVHSIVKKRRTRLDIIQKKPTQSLSNIILRYKKTPG